MRELGHVIDIVGEGKPDLGRGDDRPEAPTTGVLLVLVHRLCDKHQSMRVRRRSLPFLQKGTLWQKVRFAKRQSYHNASAGLVFVIDTEGDHPGRLEQLKRGRDSELPDHPTAIGVAHPCIEAWLLADASAISRALGIAPQPQVPPEPESLAAPCKDRGQNPKVLLGRCAGLNRPLSSAETTRIAREIRDLAAIRTRCPTSFSPFADEVIRIIKPIFQTEGINPPGS